MLWLKKKFDFWREREILTYGDFRILTQTDEDKLREEFEEMTLTLNKKLDLILDHLNLEYVPETEKMEPAKLVEKEKVIECDVHPALHGFFTDFPDSTVWTKTVPKKKKRGRPRKK